MCYIACTRGTKLPVLMYVAWYHDWTDCTKQVSEKDVWNNRRRRSEFEIVWAMGLSIMHALVNKRGDSLRCEELLRIPLFVELHPRDQNFIMTTLMGHNFILHFQSGPRSR